MKTNRNNYLVLTIVDFYNSYAEEYKDFTNKLDGKVYLKVIKHIMALIREEIIFKNKVYRPNNLIGRFGIVKRKRKIGSSNKVGIDWKQTKEQNKYIYHLNKHTDNSYFRWTWEKNSHHCRFRNKSLYNFRPVRESKRLLSRHINKTVSDPYQKPYDCLTELPKF